MRVVLYNTLDMKRWKRCRYGQNRTTPFWTRLCETTPAQLCPLSLCDSLHQQKMPGLELFARRVRGLQSFAALGVRMLKMGKSKTRPCRKTPILEVFTVRGETGLLVSRIQSRRKTVRSRHDPQHFPKSVRVQGLKLTSHRNECKRAVTTVLTSIKKDVIGLLWQFRNHAKSVGEDTGLE
jgi:hypothetical protein